MLNCALTYENMSLSHITIYFSNDCLTSIEWGLRLCTTLLKLKSGFFGQFSVQIN